ncbi:5-hydroxyisourate hydrolase [Kribbella voronezhensis]|uniref:5-hydroxyisourate hydrolase n=1 Tax=Kribbella voronezhensis TaxID=2512212 RepID=A0A4R7SYP4_9ACTN|nr:hydroxyisourate hydrolase [Kribbella voronezhensis]TDU83647.1 5-hydroxyisourate hydrolase [Kribbella voronezhensis]
MSTVTTHVLDTAQGRPAEGVPVQLQRTTDSSVIGKSTTDADGRVSDFGSGQVEPGVYQLRFDVAAYARASGQEFFFPEVTVTFTITDERHYHVPLLLSPFAYSTYRGS